MVKRVWERLLAPPTVEITTPDGDYLRLTGYSASDTVRLHALWVEWRGSRGDISAAS